MTNLGFQCPGVTHITNPTRIPQEEEEEIEEMNKDVNSKKDMYQMMWATY